MAYIYLFSDFFFETGFSVSPCLELALQTRLDLNSRRFTCRWFRMLGLKACTTAQHEWFFKIQLCLPILLETITNKLYYPEFPLLTYVNQCFPDFASCCAQWILVRHMGLKQKALARKAALTGTGTNISLEDCCQESNTSIWEPNQSTFTLFSILDVEVHSLIM